MYRIIVTEPAQKDLQEAVSYIATELKNRQAARAFLELVEREVRSLSDMPERYALVGDELLRRNGFRAAGIGRYLLFYTVRRDTRTVVIQRVLYARRDWEHILRESP